MGVSFSCFVFVASLIVGGAHQAMLKILSLFCAQESFMTLLRGTYVVLLIESCWPHAKQMP